MHERPLRTFARWVLRMMTAGSRNSVARRPSAQVGARWEHRRRAGTDGFDDLAVVDALQVDRRDTEVRVAELTLHDFQGHAFACHLGPRARGEAGAARTVGERPAAHGEGAQGRSRRSG
jgi:hypothetical protein